MEVGYLDWQLLVYMQKHKKILVFGIVILLILSLGMAIYIVQQEQDIRQSAQVSQTPPSCLSKTAINLVIDKSASMGNIGGTVEGDKTKMTVLKESLNQFIDFLSEQDQDFYIGMDVFGAPGIGNGGALTEFDYTKYEGNESMIKEKIDSLSVGPSGGTYMKKGFEVAVDKTKEAKTRPELAGYRFVTIVFSDGVPEAEGQRGSQCVAESTSGTYVCFAKVQDPRLSDPSMVTEMKDITDKLYSVVIYNDSPGSRGFSLNSQLLTLMKDIADDPDSDYFFDATTSNASELRTIFERIPELICEATPTPTPSPSLSISLTPTPTVPVCAVPEKVNNVRIECPFCDL